MLPPIERAFRLWDHVDVARAADPTVDRRLAHAAEQGRSIMHQMAGLAHALLGEADVATRALDASVEGARRAGLRWMHAVMTMRRALVHALLGRPAAALADYEASLPLLRAVGETWFASLTYEGMAAVERACGRLALAAEHARAGVAVLGDEPDAWFIARVLDTMAAIATTPAPGAALTAPRARTAARLLGAAAGLRSACGAEVLGHDLPTVNATAAAARAAAGEAAFREAWAEGEALDLAGAFALAAHVDVADAAVGDVESAAGVASAAAPGAPPARTDASAAHAAPPPAVAARSVAPAVPAAEAPAAAPAGAPALAPALAVHALGPLVVARDGAPLAGGELPAGKATELLLLLVVHPDGVTKEQVGLELWPDASPAQVRNAFHVTLHHLRRGLGGPDRDAARPWVAFSDGRYRLARALPGAALDCDVDALVAAAERLRGAERRQEALDAAELEAHGQALARRRGELGEGLAAGDWLLPHQDRVRSAWADGMHALARQHARAGRHAEGAALLQALVARDPLREAAHRELMVLWAATGERSRALAHYDALAALLRREVGSSPARDTQALAEQLRRG
jgi:DNA-binding SARP family transcriptional activator